MYGIFIRRLTEGLFPQHCVTCIYGSDHSGPLCHGFAVSPPLCKGRRFRCPSRRIHACRMYSARPFFRKIFIHFTNYCLYLRQTEHFGYVVKCKYSLNGNPPAYTKFIDNSCAAFTPRHFMYWFYNNTAIAQNIKGVINCFYASHIKSIKSHRFPLHSVNDIYITRVFGFSQC